MPLTRLTLLTHSSLAATHFAHKFRTFHCILFSSAHAAVARKVGSTDTSPRPGTACRLALELILFTGCCHITRASFDPLAQPRRHCGYVSRRSASLPLARLDHALVCVRRQVVCATFSVIVNILWPLGARRWRWSWRWRHRWTRSRAAACGMRYCP